MNTKLFASIGASALMLFGVAQAAELTFSEIEAGWQDVVGDDSNVTIDNSDNDNVTMKWEDDDDDFSSYEFHTALPPATQVNPPPTSGPILLGEFVHNNQAIDGGTTQWSDVTLRVEVTFNIDGSGPFTREFFFDFNHNETPNNANPCPAGGSNPCADIITISDNSMSQNFLIDGVVYTLSILGFSDQMDGMGAIVNQFITDEDQANSAYLFAQITAAEVPLPAAIWLMLAGLGGLRVAAGRKKAA